MLAQIPIEFNAAVRELEAAEAFITCAAGGSVEEVNAQLARKWELLHAVDVRSGNAVLPTFEPWQMSQKSRVMAIVFWT